jgi:hypothetical protein
MKPAGARRHCQKARRWTHVGAWLAYAGVAALLATVAVRAAAPQWQALGRGGLGAALLLLGLAAALRTWTDGCDGVLRGRGGRVEFRERDLPYTFSASVAFQLLVWLIFALAGLGMLLSAVWAD